MEQTTSSPVIWYDHPCVETWSDAYYDQILAWVDRTGIAIFFEPAPRRTGNVVRLASHAQRHFLSFHEHGYPCVFVGPDVDVDQALAFAERCQTEAMIWRAGAVGLRVARVHLGQMNGPCYCPETRTVYVNAERSGLQLAAELAWGVDRMVASAG